MARAFIKQYHKQVRRKGGKIRQQEVVCKIKRWHVPVSCINIGFPIQKKIKFKERICFYQITVQYFVSAIAVTR